MNNTIFAVTILNVVTEQTARRQHGAHGNKTVKRYIPVAEQTLTAPDMTAARRIARTMYAVDGDKQVRVNYAVTAADMTAARYAAYSVLNMTYNRQAADFILLAMNSISARRPNADADDVISECAMAMFDADARRDAVGVDAAAIAPNYAAYRAAYRAANRYIDGMRRREMTTARQDINHYLRISDDAAERDAAADYDAGYMTAAVIDADAEQTARAAERRAAYLDDRRAARAVITNALEKVTPKQAAAIRAYAAVGNMRRAAELLHVKNQSTIARHIQAARRAIDADAAAAVNVELFIQSDARRAERRAAVIDRAAADVAAYDALVQFDARRAAIARAAERLTHRRPQIAEQTARAVNAVYARIDAAEQTARADIDRAERRAAVAAAHYAAARRAALELTARARAAVDTYDAEQTADAAADARAEFNRARAAARRARAARAEYDAAHAAAVDVAAHYADAAAARAAVDMTAARAAAYDDAEQATRAAYAAAAVNVDRADIDADAAALDAAARRIALNKVLTAAEQTAARAALDARPNAARAEYDAAALDAARAALDAAERDAAAEYDAARREIFARRDAAITADAARRDAERDIARAAVEKARARRDAAITAARAAYDRARRAAAVK